jgi:glutamate-1-semialdehyde 2,1-aminomutase
MQFLNSNLVANPRYRNSNGPWLIDRDNRAVFDTWLGAGTLILGHSNENTCCPIKMLPEGMQISGKQKELLGNLVDFRVGGIGFQTSGSSAITRAIRLARAVTKKEEIVVVGRFWHGSEDELLFRENKLPVSSGVPKLFHEKIIWFSSLEVALQKLDPTSTAAVIVEPYQGSDPSKNTLSDLTQERRNYLQDNNILLVCDEIINGFREQYGSCSSSRIVNPDIVIFGKSIAGGTPIGLVVISEEVLIPNITLPFWGGTFSASPIQMTCMFNTLDMLAVLDYQNIEKNFSALIKRLSHYCGEFDLQISTGCSFARINNRSISNARAFVDQDHTFEKFREYVQKKSIYIARNGLLFPSIFNIDDELPLN